MRSFAIAICSCSRTIKTVGAKRHQLQEHGIILAVIRRLVKIECPLRGKSSPASREILARFAGNPRPLRGKSEIRNPKSERNLKTQISNSKRELSIRISDFGFRISREAGQGVQSIDGVTLKQNSASSCAVRSRSSRETTSTGLCM